MATQQLDLEAMKRDISEKADEALAQVADFARERPHVAVGLALGLGWVLGNGLPPRIILGAARAGWKAALGGMLASGGLASILGGDGPSGAAVEASSGAGSQSSSSGGGGGMSRGVPHPPRRSPSSGAGAEAAGGRPARAGAHGTKE